MGSDDGADSAKVTEIPPGVASKTPPVPISSAALDWDADGADSQAINLEVPSARVRIATCGVIGLNACSTMHGNTCEGHVASAGRCELAPFRAPIGKSDDIQQYHLDLRRQADPHSGSCNESNDLEGAATAKMLVQLCE